MTDLPQLLAALTGAQVEFVVVGGVAATAHGAARLTQDIDIVYARSEANLRRLAAALAPHSPYLRAAPPGLLSSQWISATRRVTAAPPGPDKRTM